MRIYQEMKGRRHIILLLLCLFTGLTGALAQGASLTLRHGRSGHERQLCLYPPVLRCSGERQPTVAARHRHILHTAPDHKQCVFHVIVSIRRQLRLQLFRLRRTRKADGIHHAWRRLAYRKQEEDGFLHHQHVCRQHLLFLWPADRRTDYR